ncbi:MAG: methionyl-tRNA formyltransferase [Ktedonobacteraceae bacterium]
MLKIIYMGTPYFAVPALEALIASGAPGVLLPQGYEIVTVITRPDKPSGRGKEMVFSPVKQAALAHNIPIWQPGSLKRAENSEALATYAADLYVVAAFGQILPQPVLDLPRYGTLNIHASLLPRYRGVSPISEAILRGDRETGVTIMLIDAGIDTGPILLQRAIPIAEDDTTGSLTGKLATLGASALLEALPLWIAGDLPPQPQHDQEASYTHMLRKEDGEIAWQHPAATLAREARAYSPWPGFYTTWRGKMLKIVECHVLAGESPQDVLAGTVMLRKQNGETLLQVATGEGVLVIERLQLEGKKAMNASEFLRGYANIVGDVLGNQ